jgi:hypothetical protein
MLDLDYASQWKVALSCGLVFAVFCEVVGGAFASWTLKHVALGPLRPGPLPRRRARRHRGEAPLDRGLGPVPVEGRLVPVICSSLPCATVRIIRSPTSSI